MYDQDKTFCTKCFLMKLEKSCCIVAKKRLKQINFDRKANKGKKISCLEQFCCERRRSKISSKILELFKFVASPKKIENCIKTKNAKT